MSAIKVLHFVPGFNYGGIETVLINTVKSVDRGRAEFDVLVEDAHHSEQLEQLIEAGCTVKTIHKYSAMHPAIYYRQLKKALDGGGYDLVHSYNLSRSWLFFLAAKRAGVSRRIFHARTSRTDDGMLKTLVLRFLIRLGIHLSTDLLANSKESGNFLFGNKKFRVMKNAIDLSAFAPDQRIRALKRHALGLEGKFVLGHVGRFTDAKNHAFLIDIFGEVLKRDDTARLLLVGDGPLLESVENKAKEDKVFEKVVFAGARSDVSEWYRAMDVFVFPSLYEGYGNAAVEAQAAGLPVVASHFVPRAVALTQHVRFMPEAASQAEWAEQIVGYKGRAETGNPMEVTLSKGFGMKEAADSLVDYYAALLEGQRKT